MSDAPTKFASSSLSQHPSFVGHTRANARGGPVAKSCMLASIRHEIMQRRGGAARTVYVAVSNIYYASDAILAAQTFDQLFCQNCT